jgi:hypothetical protein
VTDAAPWKRARWPSEVHYLLRLLKKGLKLVTPVTGPFYRSITMFGPPNLYGYKPIHLRIDREWYRQQKPHNLPLSYRFNQSRILNYFSKDPVDTTDIDNGIWYINSNYPDVSNPLYNRVYEKFRDKVYGATAQLANDWAERQQLLDLVESGFMKGVRAVRYARRGQFSKAKRELNLGGRVLGRPAGWRSGAKTLGGDWLQYWFGLSPLWADVQRATELLLGELPPIRATAGAVEKHLFRQSVGSGFSYRVVDFQVELRQRLDAQIKIINPDLYLLDQLGLMNPLAFAWEALPFSFLVDWVGNIGNVLGAMYGFPGVSLVNSNRTTFVLSKQFHTYPQHPSQMRWIGENVVMDRSVGAIPGPTLRFAVPKALSPTRAATAAALLVQHLKS